MIYKLNRLWFVFVVSLITTSIVYSSDTLEKVTEGTKLIQNKSNYKFDIYSSYSPVFYSHMINHLILRDLILRDLNEKYKFVQKLKIVTISPKELKIEYDKIVWVNTDIDRVISDIVKFLKENHYEKYTKVRELSIDLFFQYSQVKVKKDNANSALKAGDIEKAIFFENMVKEYLLNTVNIGIRAKKLLLTLI